jgi:hypothetical protein
MDDDICTFLNTIVNDDPMVLLVGDCASKDMDGALIFDETKKQHHIIVNHFDCDLHWNEMSQQQSFSNVNDHSF